MSEARRRIEVWEREQSVENIPTIAEAWERFQASLDVGFSATQKQRSVGKHFLIFCERRGKEHLEELTVDDIDSYHLSRDVNTLSWSKELGLLRQWCKFCVKRGWMKVNWAGEVDMPRGIKLPAKEPYTEEECVRIYEACWHIGQQDYERLRAYALVVVMRYTGLAIRDTYLLRIDAIRNGYITVRRTKTGKPVYLPVSRLMRHALESLPMPKGADDECPYFFHHEGRNLETAMCATLRSLRAVYKLSGVPNAHSHRFRHTLATRMLEQGASYEDVAVVLGNSAAVVEKHYAKWSKGRQERVERFFRAANGMDSGDDVNAKQVESFVYGNVHLHDPSITKQEVKQRLHADQYGDGVHKLDIHDRLPSKPLKIKAVEKASIFPPKTNRRLEDT